jgi:hypothetical protein
VSVYGVLANDDQVYCTIINKEHGFGTGAIKVSLSTSGTVSFRPQVMLLTAPKNDLAATSGVTLGDATIESDGSWSGKWQPCDLSSPIEVASASAVIIKL